ncbi:uncharacterized protein LOC141909970 [Tubulanus polymorphus]|uniref:uncharacterized protein LOC141909970 n=1 Tax=Tubulanus polymorphus TaxID=672921 RepID=UPI003DA6408F
MEAKIDSLTLNKQVDTDFRPELMTSIPGEHVGEQSRVICAQYNSIDYIYSVNGDNKQRYIEIDGWIHGLAADGNGFLNVLAWKNSEYILRKYKNQRKLLEENINLLPGGCVSLVIRDHNIYIQLFSDVHVLRLIENPVNKLIDRNRVKKYQLPDGDYKYINCLDVDSKGRMFLYCMHTHRLLYLTPEAERIGLIWMKDCDLTFNPCMGSPCVINDNQVLLSLNSDTGKRGAVISIRYNDVGFIDHPRIILNSTDSRTGDIHHVFNSNAVVINHWDYSDDPSDNQYSLRFYNIDTVEPAPDVRGNVCESGGIDQYYMNHVQRGLALIISNKEFDTSKNRIGTEFDVESLSEVFSDLGFEVVVHENLTAEEMKSKMRDGKYKKEFDYFNFQRVHFKGYIVPICGYDSNAKLELTDLNTVQKGDKVIGTDGNTVHVEELVKPFKGDACEALAGKPKLFFIQACRGLLREQGVLFTDSEQIDGNEGLRIPNEADVLIAYATVPGYVSWRNAGEGSWFIQTLCKVLKEHHRSLDLLRMLTRVQRKVADEFGTARREKQMPCVVTTLRKDLYFARKS